MYDSDNIGSDKSLGWLELDVTFLASGFRGKWFKLQVAKPNLTKPNKTITLLASGFRGKWFKIQVVKPNLLVL